MFLIIFFLKFCYRKYLNVYMFLVYYFYCVFYVDVILFCIIGFLSVEGVIKCSML